uniref:10 kDa heat shock protein, mitochondrial n=1 Tax=Nothobranchius korthausae TaxID=1143690 RepID=A0A1A8F8T0_9TELE
MKESFVIRLGCTRTFLEEGFRAHAFSGPPFLVCRDFFSVRSRLLCCSSPALYPFARVEMAFRKFLPLFDRVLVERLTADTVTKGGIMLPEKSQGKVLQATVMAVGPGSVNQKGHLQSMSVKVGEKVLLPEYGGTKVVLDDKDYYLFRDGDILGKYTE